MAMLGFMITACESDDDEFMNATIKAEKSLHDKEADRDPPNDPEGGGSK